MKDPNQAIYDEVFKLATSLGFSTYTYLPGDVGYPFIFLGEQFNNPLEAKTDRLLGKSRLTVHFYGIADKRKLLTDMASKLLDGLKRLRRADSYSIGYVASNSQFMLDNTTAQTLLHGIIEVEFEYVG